MKSIHQRLGLHNMVLDLGEFGTEDMPQCHTYEDGLQNVKTFPSLDEELEVTPYLRGGAIFKCKNITSKSGQDGKRPMSMVTK